MRGENVTIDLALSLEMIGYFSNEENSQDFPVSIMGLIYPKKGNFIEGIIKDEKRVYRNNWRTCVFLCVQISMSFL